MSDICGELGNIVEVSDLARGVFVRCSCQGKCQWLMIGHYVEFKSFHEVSDCQVYCYEFPVESAIPGLGWSEFLRKVRDWLPVLFN